jgi:hypothetical protein
MSLLNALLNLSFYFNIDFVGLVGVAEAILSIVVSAVIGIILEDRLKVMSLLKKLKSFILNTQSNLKIAFLFSTTKSLTDIKRFFGQEKMDKWRLLSDANNKLIYTDGSTNLSFVINHDSTILIETSTMSFPIREMDEAFNSKADMVESISNELGFRLIRVSFDAKLPYYQKIANFSIPRHFLIKDYSITLKDKKLDVELKLVLDNISVTNQSISELKSIFRRVLSF